MIGRKGYSDMLEAGPHIFLVQAKRICDIPVYSMSNISCDRYHRKFICASSVDNA